MGAITGPDSGMSSGVQLHPHVILEAVQEQPLPKSRAGLRRGVSVTQAAIDAGHVPEIEHLGKRFKIVCACGWSTAGNWTRKRAFQEVSTHMILAGRTALGEDPAMGKIPPVKPAVSPRVSEPSVGPSL